ncbi:chaplin family protein [Streptomyces massasporeus]|uniref:chaplin family protein n=1 Tax=Streptomyces massasporeus TaxID=67324 RepID=UPI0037F80B3B
MRQATRKGLMTVAAATGVIAAAGGSAHADSGAQGAASGSPGVLSGNSVQAPVYAPVNVCGNTVNVVGVLNPSVGNSCANKGGGSSSGGYGEHGGHGGHGGSHAGGHATDSPGVASGNHVQAPVHVPVNLCGNSVDVIGIGNPSTGNDCSNGGGHHGTPPGGGHGGSHAGGHAGDSPGVGSGNHVQVPVHVPVNVCGNSVDVVGVGNPSTGNDCSNGGGHHGTPPGGGHENPGQPGNPGNPGNPGEPGHPGTPPSTGGETPGGSSHGNKPGGQFVTQPDGDAQLASTGSDLPLGLALPAGAGALLAGAILYRKARASA